MQITSSTELNVSSSTEQALVHPICRSKILTSPILSIGEMCIPILPSTSTVDIPVCTLPSVSPILSSISVLDSVSVSIQSLLSPISSFTASPSSSTIVSIPKVKPVVETKQPLKLLLTGKEIEEDIDLDTEIEIPKIDFNTTTIEEMMMIIQLLEKKAKQK